MDKKELIKFDKNCLSKQIKKNGLKNVILSLHSNEESRLFLNTIYDLLTLYIGNPVKLEDYICEKLEQNYSPLFKRIHIIEMKDESQYNDTSGIITLIDDMGYLHGTWGGCSVNPEEDTFEIM